MRRSKKSLTLGRSVPGIAVGVGFFAACLILYPIVALAGATEWLHLPALAMQRPNAVALGISIVSALIACAVATVSGFALALVLATSRAKWAAALRVFVLIPLVLPPVVSGLALLLAYGRTGPLAPALSALGTQIVFTPLAVVFAQVFVSLPFVVLTLEGAFRARGFEMERTAAGLGASPSRVLRTITLVRFFPHIVVAAVLAFARSLGEFGATLTFAGSLEGKTRTLPLQIYLLRETDLSQAVGMAMVLVLFSLAVVFVAYARAGRSERRQR